MSVLHPLRQLEEVTEELEVRSGYTGMSRWMIPYADLVTLLLGFFVVLYASIQLQPSSAQVSLSDQQILESQNQIKQLQHQVTVYQDQLAAIKTVPFNESVIPVKGLQEKLLKDLALQGQQVTVSEDARGLVISFQERIFFGPGSANLSPQAQQTLDKLATVLRDTHRPIRVEGHTDNTPIHTAQFPSNWELSTARATKILKNLIERHHFSPQSLSAAGYGQFYPLAENSTIEGKQKNRRVDIVILNPIVPPDTGTEKHTALEGNKTPPVGDETEQPHG